MNVSEHRKTKCRGCGRDVVFVTTNDGKTVPLHPVPPVFHRVHDPDTGRAFWWRDGSDGGGERTAFVSHFATCPKANDFSGSRRGAAQGG